MTTVNIVTREPIIAASGTAKRKVFLIAPYKFRGALKEIRINKKKEE